MNDGDVSVIYSVSLTRKRGRINIFIRESASTRSS